MILTQSETAETAYSRDSPAHSQEDRTAGRPVPSLYPHHAIVGEYPPSLAIFCGGGMIQHRSARTSRAVQPTKLPDSSYLRGKLEARGRSAFAGVGALIGFDPT